MFTNGKFRYCFGQDFCALLSAFCVSGIYCFDFLPQNVEEDLSYSFGHHARRSGSSFCRSCFRSGSCKCWISFFTFLLCHCGVFFDAVLQRKYQNCCNWFIISYADRPSGFLLLESLNNINIFF